MAFGFQGLEYHYRWSQAGQHEFTPVDQADLGTWFDMITLNVHEQVTDAEQLADMANGVLANYHQHGEIVRVDSRPPTADRPAEHLVVAWLGGGNLCEVCFARFLLHDGNGLVAVYSHRTYGDAAGPAMGEWLQREGGSIEDALMGWDALPSVAMLKSLPQSA